MRLATFKVDVVLKLVGDTTNDGRGITFLWCPLGVGLELAWSHRTHVFIGRRYPWPGRTHHQEVK